MACRSPIRSRLLALALMALLPGCTSMETINPLLPLTLKDGERAFERMREEPKPFERPVVVLGGIYDPGFVAPAVARRLRSVATDDARITSLSFMLEGSFEKCRNELIERVNGEWPSDREDETVEVDVVAFSMGGLVARYAARPRTDGKPRLNVRRLFTISTPHRGARLAVMPTLDQRITDMRAGSAFLHLLNHQPAQTDPEIIPYVRLEDAIVGEENAAPPGMAARWVDNPPFTPSHLTASVDPRILADIARQLRSEPSLAASDRGDEAPSSPGAEPSSGTGVQP